MSTSKDRVYLEDIIESAQLIQDYTQNDKNRFLNDRLVQDGVMRRLQTMAESTQRLSDDLKQQAPNIDWRGLSGFRNVLVHDYLNGIDLERVWNAIANDLPKLQNTTTF